MSQGIYLELLKLAVPEVILVLTVLAVLAADALALRGMALRPRLLVTALMSSVGCVAAIACLLVWPQEASYLDGTFVVSPLTQLVQVALLALTILTLFLSVDAEFTPHVGEYAALILLSTVGMMFLVSSQNLLVIFLSLELTSLSLYVLTAFDKRSAKSAEAALKYFLFGGMAAAITLFGLSLLYGLSGQINLVPIAEKLSGPKLDPLLAVAIVMTLTGFGFKVAAAPFHLWAPDAYQAAPAPSAAFIASGSKVAGFFVLAQVMVIGFKGIEGSGAWPNYQPGWVPVMAVLAAVSMILGNLAAIVQSSVRRLLAYSAIAHAGYMLLGVMPHTGQSLVALVYYVVTYGLATLGAFGVVAIVEGRGGGDSLSDFAGLSRRAPVPAFCLLIFLLSLAGIPPLAGFFGKFYVFAAALSGTAGGSGLLWLVILALAMSAVSLYYYLLVLKQVYVVEPGTAATPLRPSLLLQALLLVVALAVVILGCAPNLLLGPLSIALGLAGGS